ncbi:MAG: trypsin-like peptidase domain-containing protein [Clostridia bacterium]|nr:trypsin-like peptidase domain-containing protein [Clostridia bacterium]
MRDFEQDPNENFDSHNDGLPETPSQTDQSKGEAFEPQNEGTTNISESNYEHPEQTNHADFNQTGGKPPKKGASSSLLVAFCLVLFIFVAISIGALLDVGNVPDSSDGTGTTESTGASSTSSEFSPSSTTDSADVQSTTSHETAPGASVIYPDTGEYISIYREVANKCIQSVVVIQVTSASGSGAGSGVIYDANGYIVTNYHVANEDCRKITVILYDGSSYEGQYIYGDELADLAVVKIDKSDCVAAEFGDSSRLTYGDAVLAIGNPLGYGLSVTTGVISRPSESVTIGNATMTLLRTDAAVNSGNSGGGLFDLNGKLIGIVNAKIAANTVDNVGYAIPSQTVVKSINDLKEYGYIRGRARLGISVTSEYYWNLSWIQVSEINQSGSAANSGLQIGDILSQCNGVKIDSFETLSQQLTKYSIGDTVTLTVYRPKMEWNQANWTEYFNTAEKVDIQITFKEFNPNS